ncbi:putative facilitator of salicylate uptake, partial [hydrothermal vent metagenome]
FFGITVPVNEKSTFALSMAAAGGMNTEYKTNFGDGTTLIDKLTKETGLNLEQVYLTGTFGRKLNKDTSAGVSIIYAYQRFEATGLGIFGKFPNTVVDDTKLTNNGIDESSGVGYKIGVQTGTTNFRLGFSYQPRIKMSKFQKYSSLFANQGEFDIPPVINAGFAWTISKFTLAFDYQNINYEDIETFSNSISKFTDEGKLFGSSNGPGFGWRSIDVYKLGFEYQYSDDWTFRTGWNKGDNPVQKGEVSLAFLAPAIITDHFTFGYTNKLSDSSSYSMNYVHSFKNTMTDEFSPTFGGGTITIEMEQKALEFGYTKIF